MLNLISHAADRERHRRLIKTLGGKDKGGIICVLHNFGIIVKHINTRLKKVLRLMMKSNMRAWLYKIMKNNNINNHRTGTQRTKADSEYHLQHEDAGMDKQKIDDPILRRYLRRMLDQLEKENPGFGKVLELVDMKGVIYEKAAKKMDVPIGTVMSRLYRGRKKIKKRLEEDGFNQEDTPDNK